MQQRLRALFALRIPESRLDHNPPEHIRLKEKLGYGVGDLASGLMLNFFGYFILIFFVDIGGLAPAAIGFMLLVTKLFDAVTDPVMGIIADRTRSRWGRYRPYLLFGTIPFAISSSLP